MTNLEYFKKISNVPLPEWRKDQDSKALREWKEKNKVGSTELAQMLGVSYVHIYSLENGISKPSGPMRRLLQVLGVLKT